MCCASALPGLAEAKPEQPAYAGVLKILAFWLAGCPHLSGTDAVPAVGHFAEALLVLGQGAAPAFLHVLRW